LDIGQVSKILSNPIIIVIITAVISFLLGNITGWISAKRDRKRLAQEKYTQKYIIEGVDPLIHYYSRLRLQLERKSYGDYMQVPDENPFPTEALAAMQILCGEDTIALVNSLLNSELGNADDLRRMIGPEFGGYENIDKQAATFIGELNKALLRIRKDLEEKIAKIDKNYHIDTSKTCEIFHEITESHPMVRLLRLGQQPFREDKNETS
jgi:hypothetical protein